MKLNIDFEENNQGINTKLDETGQTIPAKFRSIEIGRDGKSAYQIALDNGFIGTEEEWLESLHGPAGKDGYTPVKGRDYFDGAAGPKGEPGYTPVKGKDYFDGKDGQKGADGYTPVKGKDYFDGKDGANGKDGAAGPAGKDGHTPIKGTDYFTDSDKAEMVNAVKAQLITEQWTFTLADDTVITKDVVVE